MDSTCLKLMVDYNSYIIHIFNNYANEYNHGNIIIDKGYNAISLNKEVSLLRKRDGREIKACASVG